MSKTEARWVFLQCIGKLLTFATSKGIKVIVTDFDRSAAEQVQLLKDGKSKAKHSQHQDWLAMDFLLIGPDGNAIWGHSFGDSYEVLGEYWETIHEHCRWGGRFGRTDIQPGWDPYHFELCREALV